MANPKKYWTGFKITLDDVGTSGVYRLRDDVKSIVVTVSFPDGTGVAKVQATSSTDEDINNGNAIWVDWTAGSVVTTTQDSAEAPNAIRVVNEDSSPVRVDVRCNMR